MKIAISISKPEDSSSQAEIFGRSSHFFIFDNVSSEEVVIANPYFIEVGGAGIQSACFLIESGVEVLITKKIGKNPKRFLKSAKIKVYQCNDCNVLEAIKLFSDSKLPEIDDVDEKYFPGRNRFDRHFIKKREKT